jgi:hypothetical protein
LAWAKLLTTKGGPLIAILGYAGSAPSDKAGGDLIATEMGQRIAAGSKNWVQDWLKVNGNNRAWNAAGMDKSGFWWLSPSTTGQIARKTGLSTAPAAYTIKGPIPIP